MPGFGTHPDGRPVKFGELTPEARRAVVRQAAETLQAEFNTPAMRHALADVLWPPEGKAARLVRLFRAELQAGGGRLLPSEAAARVGAVEGVPASAILQAYADTMRQREPAPGLPPDRLRAIAARVAEARARVESDMLALPLADLEALVAAAGGIEA